MPFARRHLVVKSLGLFRIERERELSFPIQPVTGLGHSVVAVARAGQAERDIRRVRRDFAGSEVFYFCLA